MNPFKKFKEVDGRPELSHIIYKGIQVWAYLRVYFGSHLIHQYDKTQKIEKYVRKRVIKQFFFGFRNWFRRYDGLVLTVSNQRKEYDGLFYDRADWIKGLKLLVIELPRPDFLKRRKIASKYMVSKTPLLISEMVLAFFLKPRNKIQGEENIKNIIKETNITISYRFYIGRLLAQYKIMNLWLFFYKPKIFFIVNPAVNMGYVLACKKKNIPVVEFQHGVINENHYAYWVDQELDPKYFPDYVLTFGHREKKILLDTENHFQVKDVLPIGEFHLEWAREKQVTIPEIEKAKNEHAVTIGITGQEAYEDWLLPYIMDTAKKNPDYLFIYIPRYFDRKKYNEWNTEENLWITRDHDTFELLKLCDFHMTINSTCALEALSIGTPNILIDHEGRAKEYYEEVLPESNFNHYMHPQENLRDVIEARKELIGRDRELSEKISRSNEYVISPGFWDNLDRAVNKVLEDIEQ